MTIVVATGYLAKVSEALVQMAADSASVQALVGMGTTTLAKSRIIEDDGGAADDAETSSSTAVDGSTFDPTTTNWLVVALGDSERPRRSPDTVGNEGDFTIMVVIRPTAGDDPASALRRARNTAGAIADEIQAMFGASATRISSGECKPPTVKIADRIRSLQGAAVALIHGSWRDLR